MRKNDILVILIPTLLIVVLWVIFNIYHSFVTTTIPRTVDASIQPINPDFDQKSITDIKSRYEVSPSYELSGENIAEAEIEEDIPIVASEGAQASPGGSLSQ
jgi:cytoskeletal protein RodZ